MTSPTREPAKLKIEWLDLVDMARTDPDGFRETLAARALEALAAAEKEAAEQEAAEQQADPPPVTD